MRVNEKTRTVSVAFCNSTVKDKFPKDMPGPLQYGNGIKSYIINLLVCQMISINRAQKLVKAMIGTVIALQNFKLSANYVKQGLQPIGCYSNGTCW